MLSARGAIDLATLGDDIASSAGFTLALPGASNTFTGWSELAASTPWEAYGFWLQVSANLDSAGHGAGPVLIDIGIGGSGSEVAIIESLIVVNSTDGSSTNFFIPLRIPAGSRISVQQEIGNSSTNDMIYVMQLLSASFDGHPAFGSSFTFGANRGTSRGTVVTSGTAGAKGSWAELTSSLAYDTRELMFVVTNHNGLRGLLDVGIGAGGSEVVLLPDLHQVGTTGGTEGIWRVPVSLPAGTRIAARHQNEQSTRTLDMVGYGFS